MIPVLILDGGVSPTALAETLVGAGLPVMEVTLRTSGAFDAIRDMARVPGVMVGAGTSSGQSSFARAPMPAFASSSRLD